MIRHKRQIIIVQTKSQLYTISSTRTVGSQHGVREKSFGVRDHLNEFRVKNVKGPFYLQSLT